jgi:hypothetical protein
MLSILDYQNRYDDSVVLKIQCLIESDNDIESE